CADSSGYAWFAYW
nr:immunoglobulin heavy chain junction region [Mus musculus]MBK4186535.1 immunoglobulin heavy chain junction region [Mus musculus]MBK4186536.1 immunoglobulin heavy chain junction region [Mus musculus]